MVYVNRIIELPDDGLISSVVNACDVDVIAVEGGLLVMSQLQDSAWGATEGIDYDDVELAENPFEVI